MQITKESIFSFYNKVIGEKINLEEGLFNLPEENFLSVVSPNTTHSSNALDLGYGYGNYSIYMAKIGYMVDAVDQISQFFFWNRLSNEPNNICLLYTSPSPRD